MNSFFGTGINGRYTPLDAAGIAWRASQDNAAWAKNLMEIMTIIKANGGKHAGDNRNR